MPSSIITFIYTVAAHAVGYCLFWFVTYKNMDVCN